MAESLVIDMLLLVFSTYIVSATDQNRKDCCVGINKIHKALFLQTLMCHEGGWGGWGAGIGRASSVGVALNV